jgi:hypothetical protein
MLFALLNLSLNLILPRPARAAQVTLTWDAVSDSSLRGYKIYYGTASKNYTTSIDVKNVTSYTITGLGDGTTYYFAVTAYSSTAQSAFSGEVSYSTPVGAAKSQSCTYALSSPGASFASSGGAGSVSVTAPAGCAWSSSTPPSWLTLTSGASGTGNGTMMYSVAPNTSANSRAATLTIASRVFTVSQAGLAQYTITASAGMGGSITPSGSIMVAQGGGKSFGIASNPGYTIANVKVDGVSQGAVTSYTFTNVTTNHTIVASFAATVTYTITASAGTGGSISPSGSVKVIQGTSQRFAISASPGYTIANVKVDGVSQGAVTSYTFTNVTTNHTIVASFH